MNPLRQRASPLALPLLGQFVLFNGAVISTTTMATAIGVRHKHYKPAPKEVKRLPKKPRSTPPAGHGERFWVFNHIDNDLVVYSMESEIRKNRAYAQFAYTGKKLVPAKLRKDYWRQMAVVELGEGRGAVGRSVYQKLRELMKRHQLEWEDEALLRMTRRERGQALNDQRGNSVADMAAVLAGVGKGNRVLFDPEAEQQKQQQQRGARKQQQKKNVAVKDLGDEGVVEVKKVGEKGEETVKLHQATVYWANEQDKYYAESWTENVTHVIGLPEKVRKAEMVEEAEPVAETSQAEGEAAKAE